MAADTREWNPNRIAKGCYKTEIGNTVNEVEEYISRRVEEFVEKNGTPEGKNHLFTEKYIDAGSTAEFVKDLLKKTNWDQDAGLY